VPSVDQTSNMDVSKDRENKPSKFWRDFLKGSKASRLSGATQARVQIFSDAGEVPKEVWGSRLRYCRNMARTAKTAEERMHYKLSEMVCEDHHTDDKKFARVAQVHVLAGIELWGLKPVSMPNAKRKAEKKHSWIVAALKRKVEKKRKQVVEGVYRKTKSERNKTAIARLHRRR
jgi:hypothetical protein